MEITVDSHLDFATYRNAMFYLYYRKPLMIIITFLGAIILIISVAYAILVFQKLGQFPFIPLLLGMVFVFLMPFSVYSQARKGYIANPKIKEKLKYKLNEELIIIEGETFNSKISWNKIIQVQELKGCLLFYRSKNSADVISKKGITHELMSEIKSLINQQQHIKTEFNN